MFNGSEAGGNRGETRAHRKLQEVEKNGRRKNGGEVMGEGGNGQKKLGEGEPTENKRRRGE